MTYQIIPFDALFMLDFLCPFIIASTTSFEEFNLRSNDSDFINWETQEKCVSLEFFPCFSTKKLRFTKN